MTMSVFKCKMCGGTIEFEPGATVGVCDSCGTKQTLPHLDDDRRANLYDRANHFRRNNEFDKAAGIYETILNEDTTDAEAYWSIVLCRYGIEYVEDPTTKKRVPTVNRTQYTSIFDDVDYKSAIQYADVFQRDIYEREAAAINEIQKGILAISQKEEPFDVFICYKETDNNGRRTPDSVLANDLYHQLTQEGFKVFFSRITLEDKLGTAYEPYIFAALNSAKVMVVLGTKPEYFNAVWVKNEWSRYLSIVKQSNGKKVLIPAYRDMDPYDLPEEFSHLQAQDMSRLGFMQDLIRGIKKIIGMDEQNRQNESVQAQAMPEVSYSSNVTALLKRGNMALEDREWEKADGFFEEVLNQDAECAEAYLGKLLADRKASNLSEWVDSRKAAFDLNITDTLEACPEESQRISKAVQENVDDNYIKESEIRKEYAFDRSYAAQLPARKSQQERMEKAFQLDKMLKRTLQYAKGQLKDQIEEGLKEIRNAYQFRVDQAQKEDEKVIEEIKKKYAEHIVQADEVVWQLRQEADGKKEEKYQKNLSRIADIDKRASFDFKIDGYTKIRDEMLALSGYKDSKEIAEQCLDKIEQTKKERAEKEKLEKEKQEEEARKAAKKKRNVLIIATAIAVAAAVAVFLTVKVFIPNRNYNNAVKLMEEGKYEEAIAAFEAMNGYKDSAVQIENCQTGIKDRKYDAAVALMNEGKYEEAIKTLQIMNGYRDSAAQIEKCLKGIYDATVVLMNEGKIVEAYESFIRLGDYGDSAEKAKEIQTQYEHEKLKMSHVGDYVIFGNYEQDYNSTNGKEVIEWRVLNKENDRLLVISRYALDCQPFNTSYTSITWENCSLRKWLNNWFITDAFNSEEQRMVLSSTDIESKDKVFLLSRAEVLMYFSSQEDRLCKGTAYCYAKGANEYSEGCNWWLRTLDSGSKNAAVVFGKNGNLSSTGGLVDANNIAVRPALWISIDD